MLRVRPLRIVNGPSPCPTVGAPDPDVLIVRHPFGEHSDEAPRGVHKGFGLRDTCGRHDEAPVHQRDVA
jgi:hypothetical protein